ncbi:MAG: hypothetical protein FJ146_16880 [Deltaproteobacteria bacterium]|nr:hypothetical protein [Deltaproteobacteria bacterium]
MLNLNLRTVSRKLAGRAALIMAIGSSGIATAEECFSPGSYDSAYVPCISAVDWGNGHVDPGWTGGGNSGSSNNCYSYNRDGRSCSFVGFSEGQEGAPWGQGSGRFRCTNGCLQYLGH